MMNINGIEIKAVAWFNKVTLRDFQRRFTLMQWHDVQSSMYEAARISKSPLFNNAVAFYAGIIFHMDPNESDLSVIDTIADFTTPQQ